MKKEIIDWDEMKKVGGALLSTSLYYLNVYQMYSDQDNQPGESCYTKNILSNKIRVVVFDNKAMAERAIPFVMDYVKKTFTYNHGYFKIVLKHGRNDLNSCRIEGQDLDKELNPLSNLNKWKY